MTNSNSAFTDPAMNVTRSLQFVTLTVALASITHAAEFGPAAFVVGAVSVGLMYVLLRNYRNSGSRFALVPYVVLTLWVIFGLGVVGGLWNHAVKMMLIARNGAVPEGLEGLFMSPDPGSIAMDHVGMFTFVASVPAAYFGFRFARAAAR